MARRRTLDFRTLKRANGERAAMDPQRRDGSDGVQVAMSQSSIMRPPQALATSIRPRAIGAAVTGRDSGKAGDIVARIQLRPYGPPACVPSA